jgi:hypothetical protein
MTFCITTYPEVILPNWHIRPILTAVAQSGPEVLALYWKRDEARWVRERGVFARFRYNDLKAIGHEAETAPTKKTYHYKICPAPARPRARQSRSLGIASPAWTPNGVIVTPSMNSLTGIVRNLAWLSTEL